MYGNEKKMFILFNIKILMNVECDFNEIKKVFDNKNAIELIMP